MENTNKKNKKNQYDEAHNPKKNMSLENKMNDYSKDDNDCRDNSNNISEDTNSEKKYLKKTGLALRDSLSLVGEVAILYALINTQDNNFIKNIKTTIDFANHSKNTANEILTGKTKGQKSAEELKEKWDLEKAIAIVEGKTKENKEHTQLIKELYNSNKERVEEIVNVYKLNETTIRQIKRLKVQLKGALKNFYEAGNELKPEIIKDNIDKHIISAYAKIRGNLLGNKYKNMKDEEVLKNYYKNSDKLKEFYDEANKFYKSRDKNETTVKEFCDYLSEIQKTTKEKNKKINEVFPEIISRVKEGYRVEDIIFEIDKKNINISKEDNNKIKNKVNEYSTNVDKTQKETYATIGKEIPQEKETHYDMLMNNLDGVLAIGGVLLYRGIARSTPILKYFDKKRAELMGGLITKPLSMGTNYLIVKPTKFIYNKIKGSQKPMEGKKNDE